jgi:hypothetical protein
MAALRKHEVKKFRDRIRYEGLRIRVQLPYFRSLYLIVHLSPREI